MRLLDLEPKWLTRDGKRIGVIFRSPKRPKWWLTCFAVPTTHAQQCDAVEAAIGGEFNWLPCKETIGWTISGGIEAATFETLTVQPSIDAGTDLWHGHVTNGQIEGGI